jgi:hypothetical protein
MRKKCPGKFGTVWFAELMLGGGCAFALTGFEFPSHLIPRLALISCCFIIRYTHESDPDYVFAT